MIRLDLLIAIPEDLYGPIVRHSGLVNTRGIIVQDGTIDSDYQGVVCVVFLTPLVFAQRICNGTTDEMNFRQWIVDSYCANDFEKVK